MAKLWIGNFAPDVTDEELRAFLVKYGFPEPDESERIDADGPRPAATVAFHAKTTSELAELATRIHDVYWRGHSLNVQVLDPAA
jgi:RNA recognition motif-containing protein